MPVEIDQNCVDQLKDIMGESYSGFIDVFLKEAAGHVQNLQKASEEKNVQEVTLSAHSLKSSSGNVGLTVLSETARNLEKQASAAQERGMFPDDLIVLIDEVDALFQEAHQFLKQSIAA